MTGASAKAPNTFAAAVGGLLSGGAAASWFALFHFVDKWKMTGPQAPEGDFIYAHVEHGGLTYFNAMQSTASHLYLPIWGTLMVGILIANAAYGENAFRRRRMTRDDLPIIAFQLVGAAVAVGIIYYFGHAILDSLVTSPFGPGNDDLSMVDHD